MVQSGLNKSRGDDLVLSCCQLDFKGGRSVRSKFTEIYKLPRGISRKTYAANPRNSVTNL